MSDLDSVDADIAASEGDADHTTPTPSDARHAPSSHTGVATAPAAASISLDLGSLPNYSRSLLKIRVPVSVQLAGKKELVQEVISLAPGSIIKFEKGCEELLQLIVGEHLIAEGEAVKIGDKFGFRVTSMVMPREHFVPVKRVSSRPGAGGS